MRASVILPALLGAGAFAQPRLKHLSPHRRHHKRDEVNVWRQGNEVVEEHIVDVYVEAPPGQNLAATAAPLPSVPVAGKYAVHHAPQYKANEEQFVPASSVAPVVVIAPSVTPVVALAQAETSSYVAPQPSTSAVVESTPTTDTSSAPDTYWSSSPMSPIYGGSGAVDVLTSANNWRNKWMAASPPAAQYTWSAEVAQNSYNTAMVTEDHAEFMAHSLLPLNLKAGVDAAAQNEASGRGNAVMNTTAQSLTGLALTPFEEAWFGWMCEMPNDVIVDTCKALGYNWNGTAPVTGHATNIQGNYNSFGCYYMNATNADGSAFTNENIPSDWLGYWTCDFAQLS
ncbi:hypothetical protein P7C71_g1336, partial [Lecanoromycetidae sp. Uapishka_2]